MDAEPGVDMKYVQIKGCFDSRKNEPERCSKIVIPFDTHRDNSNRDYLYHIGTYSLDDELEKQVPIDEAVLTHREVDVLINCARTLDPIGVSVNDSSKGRLRAQVDSDIFMDYAELINSFNREISRNKLYGIVENVFMDYSGVGSFEDSLEDLNSECEVEGPVDSYSLDYFC